MFLPQLKEAWERGETLFQEDLDRVKGQEYLDYFSLIDFAVDGYAYLSASHAFPDTPALQNRTVNGSLLM